jgi:hypothetical protein
MLGRHPESEQTKTQENSYGMRGEVGFDGIRGIGENGKLRKRKMLRQRIILQGGGAEEDRGVVSQLNCNRASSELNQPHGIGSRILLLYFTLLPPAPQPGVYGEQMDSFWRDRDSNRVSGFDLC